MRDEYVIFLATDTWTLCPQPTHHNIIRTKWVHKVKQKADGSIERYKARLLTKGFQRIDRI